ncbi:Amidinotransferase [Dictyocaulus viviparus]|uniref:Amidinotransferase n=1 Tax=Dictyocaulus viviparus TaxID=29172 RepID=A0A0D8Y5P0_DICVI|nr:Amidinotransferase [Dictyocaulus viviparus]
MKFLVKETCRILMCKPIYYRVAYSINPWMRTGSQVDTNRAMEQWNILKKTIENCGGAVEVMEPTENEKDLPDLVFTANAAIVRGKQVYVANFLHPQRQPESKFNEMWFRKSGFYTYFNPEVPYEGTGDALWCNRGKVLICGVGPRSDVRAVEHIRKTLCTRDEHFMTVAVRLVDKRFYHLDTCFCPLDDKLALWFPKAFDSICQLNLANFAELLPVDENEAENFACNSVVIGKNVIMNEGSERVAKKCNGYIA